MAQKKYDGVVDAVHFAPDGSLVWVRAYERRGPTYSDLVLIDRLELVKRLKAGKKFVLGQRILHRASDFEFSQAFRLVKQNAGEFVALEGVEANGRDNLTGALII